MTDVLRPCFLELLLHSLHKNLEADLADDWLLRMPLKEFLLKYQAQYIVYWEPNSIQNVVKLSILTALNSRTFIARLEVWKESFILCVKRKNSNETLKKMSSAIHVQLYSKQDYFFCSTVSNIWHVWRKLMKEMSGKYWSYFPHFV